jgi:hypothetical protein
MATALKLRADIKKLKDALKVKNVPANIKSKLQNQLQKSQDELAAIKKGRKTPPSRSAVKGTQTALSRLKKLLKSPKYSVYGDGETKDIQADAVEGAMPKGRRISKGIKANQFGTKKENKGKVYYEYRSNRLDVKQPKKRQTYPKLEQGGMMAMGGKLSMSKFKEQYDENEDNNMHSENVVLLAENFGTKDDIRDAKTILAKHNAIGSLPYYLMQERDALSKKLYAKYQQASKKKVADGGVMDDGGMSKIERMRKIKNRLEDEKMSKIERMRIVKNRISASNKNSQLNSKKKVADGGMMADGGEMEEGVDLFEDYENIPYNVQEILDKYERAFEDGDYTGLGEALKELQEIGYTFEFYLDGGAYDLRKIGQKGKSEVMDEDYYASGGYMAKGGEIKKGDFVRVDNPYWKAAMGTEKPVVRKVTMVSGDDVFFKDGSTSSIKYVSKMEEGGVLA